MVDNMWAQWQSKDLENRQYAVYGTNRSLNIPPATNVTIDFEMQFNYLAGPITMRDVSSTQQGEYCYRYDYTEGAPSPF
jgi:tyrosinase